MEPAVIIIATTKQELSKPLSFVLLFIKFFPFLTKH